MRVTLFRTVLIIFILNSFSFAEIKGIVKPIYEIELSPMIDGVVSVIYHKEGSFVKKGRVVLKLRDKLQKLELKRRELILNDNTRVESLKKRLQILEKIIDSKERLYKESKSIKLNDLRKLKIEYEKKVGELNALLEEKRKQKIEYEITKERLTNHFRVRSPIDGVVVKLNVEIGEWVRAGEVVATVVDSSRCFVEVDVGIEIVKDLSVGQKVNVLIKDKKSIKKDGVVKFISSVADSSSQLVGIKIFFDNTDLKVTPGVLAEVVLP